MFNGPQISELMRDTTFDKVLTEAEKEHGNLLKIFPLNFLGKNVAQTMKKWFMS